MSAIPKQLPADLEAYARSPLFTSEDLPSMLRARHSMKPGVWGLIHVQEGRILFQLEAPYQGEQQAAAGENVVIEPEVFHHVEFVEPGSFFIEFYRPGPAAA